jgi:hypothetical protein
MRPLAVEVKHSEIVIAPAACLHWPIGERDLLNAWVESIRSRPNAYGILLGDSTDFARTTTGVISSLRGRENSQEALDEYIREEVRKLAKVLEPIKSRIWGVVRGNHFHEFLEMTNSEQYLCQLLGLRYMGALGMLRVTMKSPVQTGGSRTIKIYCHHSGGTKGARTTGGDIAGMMRVEHSWDADIYLCAHTHRRQAWKEPVMTVTTKGEPKIVERTKVFARCGAFLKGFREDNPNATQPHRPSYAEEAAYALDLGWVEMR